MPTSRKRKANKAKLKVPPRKKSSLTFLENFLSKISTHPFAAFLGLIATLLAIYGFFSGIFYPDLSVSTYNTSDPKLPLETRFLVTNTNPFSLYNIQYNCESKRTIGASDVSIERVGHDEKPELPSKMGFSIYCGEKTISGEYVKELPDEIEKNTTSEILNIYVHFRILPWPAFITRDFGFYMKRDSDGNAQWLPTAQSMPVFGKIF